MGLDLIGDERIKAPGIAPRQDKERSAKMSDAEKLAYIKGLSNEDLLDWFGWQFNHVLNVGAYAERTGLSWDEILHDYELARNELRRRLG